MTARVIPAMIAGSPWSRSLVGEIEPVPASRGIGARRLFRIGDDEAQFVGEAVHARADGEVVGVLRAAVQHDDQGNRAASGALRNIDLVVPGAGGAGEASPEIGGPLGDRDRRRFSQPGRRRGAGPKARYFRPTQQFQDLAERLPRSPAWPSLRRRAPRWRLLEAPGPLGDPRSRIAKPAAAEAARRSRGSPAGGAAQSEPARASRITRVASITFPARVSCKAWRMVAPKSVFMLEILVEESLGRDHWMRSARAALTALLA